MDEGGNDSEGQTNAYTRDVGTIPSADQSERLNAKDGKGNLRSRREGENSPISSKRRAKLGKGVDGTGVVDEIRRMPLSEKSSHVISAAPAGSQSISSTSSSSSDSSDGDVGLGTETREHVSTLDLDDMTGSAGADEQERKDDITLNEKGSPDGHSLKQRRRSSDSTGQSQKSGERAEPKIEYFCAPDQHFTSDSWKIMIIHMIPFTTVPQFIALFFLWWAYSRWGWIALLSYMTMCSILIFSKPFYSRRIREKLADPLYGVLARYVPNAQYIVPEKPFPENRAYIFAGHPHGRMFYSTVIFCQFHNIWRKNILQRGDLFMTAAGGFFFVPFLRNLFYLVGVIPASKRDIVNKLRKNDHVTILVGGVKEVLLGTADDIDALYLKKRKGFCKLAMKENAGVVPVYFFNENQMFNHNSKSFLKFWERVNRHFRVGVPFMRGRYFILPMPFRKPLLIAVGEPLFAEEGESLDAFHGRYMEALEELFEKYVAFSPDPKHKLVIT